MKRIAVFKVKVNYKSGISETFECTSFKVEGKNIKWTPYRDTYRPLDIAFCGTNDIESVWQVGYRKVFCWKG